MKSAIKLASDGTAIGCVSVSWEIKNNGVEVHFKDDLGNEGEIVSRCLFYALSDIREYYSKNNVVLLCKGSLNNVFVGGLTSSSSFGELAYQLEGNVDPAGSIINIFDSIGINDIAKVGSFESQKKKRMEWVAENKVRL